ncbi:MAG: hypothetical protein GQ570_11755 [Helicobacteraceae bacterium]|nr:hypothetical protein [Helicobacteraceae bacterium]
MSVSELNSWSMYFRVEPSNSVEIQIAYLTYMAGAFLGNKGKTLEDYLITVYKPEKAKKEEENIPHSALIAMFGATVK